MISTYQEFVNEFYELTKINLLLYKENQMKRRINSFIEKYGYNGYESFYNAIKVDLALYDAFLKHITINVSEFFRNPQQWNTLEKEILPKLISKKRTINIWSSACSRGQEPYTLAMVLSRLLPIGTFKILATDIDEQVLQSASKGEYIDKELINLSEEQLKMFFYKEGKNYIIKPEIRRCIEFKKLNLLEDKYPEGMDLIICRNVLIYFTEEAKKLVYTKFSKSINSGGILFVGSTEQILVPANYEFMVENTFFYRKM